MWIISDTAMVNVDCLDYIYYDSKKNQTVGENDSGDSFHLSNGNSCAAIADAISRGTKIFEVKNYGRD